MKTILISSSLLLLLIILPTKAQTWEFVGLDSLLIKQLYVSGDTIWAGTDARINQNMIAGLYKSTNGGSTWNQLDSALGDGTSVCFYKNPINNLFYIVKGASEWSLAGTFYKSTDQGENWEIIQQLEDVPVGWIGVSNFDKNEIYAKESHYITAGWYATVFRSLDGANNWQEITSSFPLSSHGRSMAFNLSMTDGNKLYAAVNDMMGSEYFFISFNKGDSWNYITDPPGVPSELINDSRLSTRIYTSSVYISEDDGYTWELANWGLPDTSYYLSFYESTIDTNEIYALRSDGLYKSEKENIYWNRIEESKNLPLNIGSYGFIYEDIGQLRNVFIDTLKNEIYVGTAKGIYKKDITTDISEAKTDIPSEYILHQNYPNPFNPITTISYTIPERSFITLKVYDILGNEIKMLVAQEQSAGKYEIEFDGSELTSAVYFHILTAQMNSNEIYREGKKMVLLK